MGYNEDNTNDTWQASCHFAGSKMKMHSRSAARAVIIAGRCRHSAAIVYRVQGRSTRGRTKTMATMDGKGGDGGWDRCVHDRVLKDMVSQEIHFSIINWR